MRSRDIPGPHTLAALLLAMSWIGNDSSGETDDHPGLICRLEITTPEGKNLEIMELKEAGDGVFDLAYTQPYIQGEEKPSVKLIAKGLGIANRSRTDPRLIELSSFNHGRPGAYFIRLKTSILAETRLGAVGHSDTNSTLVFRLTRALQDQDLNHRLVDEEIFKMPLSSCQAR